MTTQRIDPATLQTAAGMPSIKMMNDSLMFTLKEKSRLAELGKRVAEIAALPVQQEKAKLWTAHNDLKTHEPLVFIDPENGWNECIPADTLICATPMARVWEMCLLKQIYWFEVFKDDKVIEPYFNVPHSYTDSGWGVELKNEGGGRGGAYKIVQAIKDYEVDFPRVHYPEITVDHAESEAVMELARDVFDGVLTVRQKTEWWWSLGMTNEFIRLRGLEGFMYDLIDQPEYVHKLMGLLCDGILKKLEFLENNGYLFANTGGSYVGSGGFGYTGDLPAPGEKSIVTTADMWGFVESQETVSVSPQMYGEFVYPYHKLIAGRFGLNCYGCCEAFALRWKYVRELPRLRRVSASPWENWDKLPELLGSNYIASIKPKPAHLAQRAINEDVVRAELKKATALAKDCVVEIIMKDNNTLGGNPANASRWVEIAREEIAKA